MEEAKHTLELLLAGEKERKEKHKINKEC